MCCIAGLQDLSSAGAQPMLPECGGYALNYNGELYNAVELRRLLDHMHSRSQTERVRPGMFVAV